LAWTRRTAKPAPAARYSTIARSAQRLFTRQIRGVCHTCYTATVRNIYAFWLRVVQTIDSLCHRYQFFYSD